MWSYNNKERVVTNNLCCLYNRKVKQNSLNIILKQKIPFPSKNVAPTAPVLCIVCFRISTNKIFLSCRPHIQRTECNKEIAAVFYLRSYRQTAFLGCIRLIFINFQTTEGRLSRAILEMKNSCFIPFKFLVVVCIYL